MGPITPRLVSIMKTSQPTPTAIVQVGPNSHESKIKQHTVLDLSTRPEFSIRFQNRDRIEVFLISIDQNYSESSNGRSEGLNLVVKVSKRGFKS